MRVPSEGPEAVATENNRSEQLEDTTINARKPRLPLQTGKLQKLSAGDRAFLPRDCIRTFLFQDPKGMTLSISLHSYTCNMPIALHTCSLNNPVSFFNKKAHKIQEVMTL